MMDLLVSRSTLRAVHAAVVMGGVMVAALAAMACSQPTSKTTGAIPTTTATAADVTAKQAPLAAAPSPSATASQTNEPPLPPWVTIADSGPVEAIDLHVDTPWKVHFKGRALSLPEGHATPSMLRDGHYAGIVYPIYIPDYIHNNHPTIADADAILETIEKLIATHALLCPATNDSCPPDTVAAFIAIEGGGAFAEDITQIDRFIKRGVRLVGPVHAHDNKLASSATGKKDRGLTPLGKEFCARVYAAGALVDVSHMSDRSFADLLPIARQAGAPVVATHSNARVKRDHHRNLTDEQLRTIAATGGIAGLNLYRSFVPGKGRMKDVVGLVRHMVAVAGIDHVAIGSDFDGGTPVRALRNAGQLPKLAKAMQEAGMSDQDVRKIFAKNALRMLSWSPPTDG